MNEIGLDILDDNEEDLVWTSLKNKFNFETDTRKNPRGIIEPSGSITFSLKEFFTIKEKKAFGKKLNISILTAFASITQKEEYIYALDWQHPCYRLYPNKIDIDWYANRIISEECGLFKTEDDINYYLISAIPDGDYHIFISRDFRSFVFGHPWQKTICVLGDGILNELKKNTPGLFHNVLRKN